jgi:hypothetical protein
MFEISRIFSDSIEWQLFMLITFFWLQERPYLHARFFFSQSVHLGLFLLTAIFYKMLSKKTTRCCKKNWWLKKWGLWHGQRPLHLHLQTTGWDHDHMHRCISSKMFLLWAALNSSWIGPIYFLYSLKLRRFQVFCNLLVIRTLSEVKFQGKSSQHKIRRTYGNCWQGHVPNTYRQRVLNDL